MFQALNVFPGVTHITDVMGVSFTLIEGKEKAIPDRTRYHGHRDDGKVFLADR